MILLLRALSVITSSAGVAAAAAATTRGTARSPVPPPIQTNISTFIIYYMYAVFMFNGHSPGRNRFAFYNGLISKENARVSATIKAPSRSRRGRKTVLFHSECWKLPAHSAQQRFHFCVHRKECAFTMCCGRRSANPFARCNNFVNVARRI